MSSIVSWALLPTTRRVAFPREPFGLVTGQAPVELHDGSTVFKEFVLSVLRWLPDACKCDLRHKLVPLVPYYDLPVFGVGFL